MRKVSYEEIDLLVVKSKTGDNNALFELYKIFEPTFFNLLSKWSISFCDQSFKIVEHDDIISDIFSWFRTYVYKYKFENGVYFATYIKRTMDARIRYIYQCKTAVYEKEHAELPVGYEQCYYIESEEDENRFLLKEELLLFLQNKPSIKKLHSNDKLVELLKANNLPIEILEEAISDKKLLRKLVRTAKNKK